MAHPITDMTSSITTTSEEDKDTEVLWMSHVIGMIKKLKDNPSTDCSIIVGETKIPVHKTVLQLNSSLLTSRSVGFDEHNEVTEIAIEPEFVGKPDLIKDIVTSFYSGTIDVNEAVIKEVYKSSVVYEIGWLKVHIGRLIDNYLTKSVYGCYERFTEIFSLAHFIWDTDLLESCIQVIDEDILELLMKDNNMLGKMSYKCMEVITMSSNVGLPEKDLFDLLVAWVTCKKQTCKKIFQNLFENLRYNLLDKEFVIKRVMTYISRNEDIFSTSFIKKIRDGLSDSSKDMCRSEQVKETALKRVQNVLDTILSADKTQEEKVKEVNSFLIRKDIRYLTDEIKGELSDAIWRKGTSFIPISSLEWLSVANLINNHQSNSTVAILEYYTSGDLKPDWTKVTDKAVIGVINTTRLYIEDVDIAMPWCVANRDTCDDATLERIVSEICCKGHDNVYNSNILSLTIKHLLPNATELKCHHSRACEEEWGYEIKNVNEKLYKLEPFEDDVATLTDNNGVLKLTFKGWRNVMFIKDKPYKPFYPVYCETVDDETLRRFIATLQDDDEIVIINLFFE